VPIFLLPLPPGFDRDLGVGPVYVGPDDDAWHACGAVGAGIVDVLEPRLTFVASNMHA